METAIELAARIPAARLAVTGRASDGLRPVFWLGNARNLKGFPEGAQKMPGDELQLIQFGGMPKDAEPFKGVGSGVLEIALRYASDAYRVVVAIQLGSCIYVLHAFQKKSTKGIATRRGMWS